MSNTFDVIAFTFYFKSSGGQTKVHSPISTSSSHRFGKTNHYIITHLGISTFCTIATYTHNIHTTTYKPLCVTRLAFGSYN